MRREPIFGESGETFLDLVKVAVLIVLIHNFGVPMMERAWENRSMLLEFIGKVYGQ